MTSEIADLSDFIPSSLGVRAYCGCVSFSGVNQRSTIQLFAASDVEVYYVRSRTTAATATWSLTIGTVPVPYPTFFPVQVLGLGTIPPQSQVTIALPLTSALADFPSITTSFDPTVQEQSPMLVQAGQTLIVQRQQVTSGDQFFLAWRELPAAAKNPNL